MLDEPSEPGKDIFQNGPYRKWSEVLELLWWLHLLVGSLILIGLPANTAAWCNVCDPADPGTPDCDTHDVIVEKDLDVQTLDASFLQTTSHPECLLVTERLDNEPHDPIIIMDNSDFTEENGVSSGSGTVTDPYVIENLLIHVDDYYGIRVYGTDKHFIIRNVITDGDLNSTYGISFSQTAHGSIVGCEISENYVGIAVADSIDISVDMNTVRDIGDAGISLHGCSNCTVSHNDVSSEVESWRGIDAGLGSTLIGILHNNISHIRNNLGLGFGIGTWYADNLTIRGNHVSDCDAGIHLGRTNDTITCENSFVDNSMHAHWGDYFDSAIIYVTTWNDQYRVGGNYWSGHTGADLMNGPQQDIPGRDGISDVPYVVMYLDSVPILDEYPLMLPVGTNRPPVASFDVSQAENSRLVAVDALSSWDYEDADSQLRFRWDWENDSEWDTEWSWDRSSEHLYQMNGTVVVRLQVIDTDGEIGETSLSVWVEGSYPIDEPEPDNDDWLDDNIRVLGMLGAVVFVLSSALLVAFWLRRNRSEKKP